MQCVSSASSVPEKGKSDIHSSTVIMPGAEIGEGCRIGPFCTIGKQVKLGPGCVLHSHVALDGCLSVGAECEIFPFACLGKASQDLKYQGGDRQIRIGQRNTIREYVTVNAPTDENLLTAIGDDCLIQAYCHIAHECLLGSRIVLSSNTMLAGHIEVGDDAWIAGYVGVVPFVRIGSNAYVGGYSKVTQDVPPFCLADGIPAETRVENRVGLERSGRTPEVIQAIRLAYKKIFRSGLPLEQALTELEPQAAVMDEIAHLVAFCRSSQRGLARPRTGRDSSGD